jgi:nitroimidazol reductase NimA-like FMN-containing flavoprotein (pyridoxamine 5'-phosphate oxidase superfamily)
MEQPGIGILNANRIMTIGTVREDGWPQTTMVGFANEGWRVYFLIYRTSQKFRNISLNPRVSISVDHEPTELRQIKAVYAGCMAREVEVLAERSRAWMLLAERHPNLTDLAPPGSDEVATMVADCCYVSVLDYSRGLGHSEEIIVQAS